MKTLLNLKLSNDMFLNEKIFFFKDLEDYSLNQPGIYSWYLCPQIHRFENVPQFRAYLEETVAHVQKFFTYNLVASSEHFLGSLSVGSKPFFYKQFCNELKDEDVHLLHLMVPKIFLNLPPIRTGLAVEQSLSDRLKQYRNNNVIKPKLKGLGSPLFNLDNLIVRTQEFSKQGNYKNLINIYESWMLSNFKPILNEEF